MKQKLMIAVALVAVLAVPAYSFAATYGYVNMSGQYKTVEAANATAALLTSDIAHDSGVILLGGMVQAVPAIVSISMNWPTATTTVMATSTMMASTSTMMTASTTVK